ncbi:hypothetical protein JCM24511_02096 [Saitozyma sp. JCM 24511]|nr:hypothetical protein JCM24511_02096 [Saitozyma sp. JCM 24511]
MFSRHPCLRCPLSGSGSPFRLSYSSLPSRASSSHSFSSTTAPDSGSRSARSGNQPVITYLPYTFGYASLLQTLHGYNRVDWRHIVIVDNSWDHHAHAQRARSQAKFPCVRDVITTPFHLRFAQLQGMIDTHARAQGAEVYLWGHNDVIVLQDCTSPYANMERCLDSARSVVVMFFAYDLV